ncbi:hypothetical protein SAY86_029342 [Trapa natans]|uniref:Uncharacterized protein n=1 Tax=Trapa natans TaxID=22666 RepID=A0AAN7ML96_TRANT|nr:hypothetical protein SAY86_029342 [Trapa natans]
MAASSSSSYEVSNQLELIKHHLLGEFSPAGLACNSLGFGNVHWADEFSKSSTAESELTVSDFDFMNGGVPFEHTPALLLRGWSRRIPLSLTRAPIQARSLSSVSSRHLMSVTRQ